MPSHSRHLGIALVLLAFASALPVTVGAQTPTYLTQWSYGFSVPQGLAVGPGGVVYVADGYGARIVKFTDTGTYLTQWGTAGSGNGEFNYPWALATDAAGNVYLADEQNYRLQKFTSTGAYITQWGGFGNGNGQFNWPRGVAVDSDGNVFVADAFNFRVQKFTSAGVYITQWGTIGSGDGEFFSPQAIAADPAGNVFVAEGEGPNQRIQKFTGAGAFVTKWGSYGNGVGQIWDPYGLGTDFAGNVYVPDTRNHRIQVFTNDGTFITQWGTFGSGDGEFHFPVEVTTDAAGNIYVLDQGNSRVQKFGPLAVPPPPVTIAFDLVPQTLNLISNGRWVTGFLEPPSPLVAGDIDVASIRLNGTVVADQSGPAALGDHDGNGVTDLMVKFDREAVELTVSAGGSVPIHVTGTIGTSEFDGVVHIGVIRGEVLAPQAGARLAPGSAAQVRWQTPSGVTVHTMTLLRSVDGGETWNTIAHGQPNTGSYDWTVPNIGTDRARIAIVLEYTDETGVPIGRVLGISDPFAVDALVGVGDVGSAQLALRGAAPNPARLELTIRFSLASSDAATLDLFDFGGRRIATRRVDTLGPGWHSATIGEGANLPAGVYVIRLTQGDRSFVTRAAVIR